MKSPHKFFTPDLATKAYIERANTGIIKEMLDLKRSEIFLFWED